MGVEARAKQGARSTRLTRRGFIALCMLVLALCAAHQLLMASERHGAVMAPLHERFIVAPAAVTTVAAAMHGTPEPGAVDQTVPPQPQPLMGECPALQGILPFLLFLTMSLGLSALVTALLSYLGSHGRRCSPRRRIPPLLPPPQRRALLQVFII